jgi:4-hydroxy-tetrahydrodipicolinate synthase
MQSDKTLFRGVLTPAVTFFDSNFAIDSGRFLRHCDWLLANDVGLAVFGTNSEGNSMSARERVTLLEIMARHGIPMDRVMAGTGACSLDDAATMTKAALDTGCGGVLMLPPFYYKDPDNDGLLRFYGETIRRVKDDRLQIYLYHFPAVAKVSFSFELIRMLLAEFPGVIRGIKDTSGDPSHTRALLANFASDRFDIFPGNEIELASLLQAGAAGCITATANVNPAALAELARVHAEPEAPRLQQRAEAIRSSIGRYPMIPAMKAILASHFSDPDSRYVRPPLTELQPEAADQLLAALNAIDFQPPAA